MKTTAFSTSLDSKPLPPLEKGVAGQASQAHGITKEGLLEFLDELNMKKRGNPIWQDIISIGDSLKQAGKIDRQARRRPHPPFGKDRGVELGANRELFGPKGLKASFMSAKQLRKHLGMAPSANLALPLEHRHIRAVPTQEELINGKRSQLRSAHRQIFALDGRVTKADLAAETNISWRSETDSGRKWAGKGIHDWQLYTELNMEFSRGKAIKRREEALAEPTEAKKKKGLKAARKLDVEVKSRSRWRIAIDGLSLKRLDCEREGAKM
ncbi:hypothetical protein B0H11DRAFT_2248098 [Mycena galericulata]|nr:hypothetical protein B0H11DRAFT_2248098 [Mycena galericulata]